MLTDPEREKLLQIERYLADDDPQLARLLSFADGSRRSRRARIWYVLLLTLALVMLVALGLGLTQ